MRSFVMIMRKEHNFFYLLQEAESDPTYHTYFKKFLMLRGVRSETQESNERQVI